MPRRPQDLWLHLPTRYEDRTRLTRLADLVHGEPAQVEARVEAVERGFRWRPLLRVMLSEAPRHTLALRFFRAGHPGLVTRGGVAGCGCG